MIRAAISESRLDVDLINEVYMGCVLQAGVGMAPARQAALAAEIPISVPCTTVNKNVWFWHESCDVGI